jgi:hypothetical protein
MYPQLGDDPDATRILTKVSRPRPTYRLPAIAAPETDEPERTLIVPSQPQRTLARIPAASQARRLPVSRFSRLITFVGVLVALAVALGLHIAQATQQTPPPAASVPAPSGSGPWSAKSGSLVVIAAAAVAPVTQSTSNIPASLQPCHDSTMFLPPISEWSVPPGCYGNIYQPNPANYPSAPGFGWCNWWVRVTHPNHPDITESLAYPRGTNPIAGAPIFFDGNEQGASSEGHWAVAVAVAPDHYWVLISEMNFAWRGAGWGKLDYRYIHVSPNVHFVYIFS